MATGPSDSFAASTASPLVTTSKPVAAVAGLTAVATQNCTVSMRGVTSPGVGSPALLNEPVVDAGVIHVSLEPGPPLTTIAAIGFVELNRPPVGDVLDRVTTLELPDGSSKRYLDPV